MHIPAICQMNALLTLQLQVLQGRRKRGGWGANRPLPPEFGRFINSIPTGGRLCQPHYYTPPYSRFSELLMALQLDYFEFDLSSFLGPLMSSEVPNKQGVKVNVNEGRNKT